MTAALLAVLLSAPAAGAGLTLEEKVGQLFMVPLDAQSAAGHEQAIRAGRIGGGLLRWDKFTGKEAAQFSEIMQDWAQASARKAPFLIAVDHEGGALFTQRTLGVTVFPGNMALGAARSPLLAWTAARTAARELRAIGVHVNFAPVLDVNANPKNPVIGLRSFGEDPAWVRRLGLAALQGYQDGGVLSVVKHFPGHGDTTVDSHVGLPVSAKTRAALEREDLAPFRAAVRAKAPALMPAHMVFKSLADDARPVSLSSAVLRGLLRGRWGYKGLVVSDSLDMGAITKAYGPGEAAVLAFEAGNDILLLGHTDHGAAYGAVLAAVRSGRVPLKRLDASVARILAVKRRYAGSPTPAPDPAAGRAVSRDIAERAVTVVRDDKKLLPVKPGAKLLAVVARGSRHAEETALFFDALKKRSPRAKTVDLAVLNPGAEAVRAAADLAREADLVVAGTYSTGGRAHPAQERLLEALLATGTPVVQVSLMSPYDLGQAEGVGTLVAVYGMTPDALEAGAKVLFGELKPRGRLPVTIPGVAERGAGL